MHYETEGTYHIFNRSNEILFYNDDNYIFFIDKIRNYILPYADILAYCLMPNHYHLMLTIKQEGTQIIPNKGNGKMQRIADAIGILNSSYTQAVNKKLGRRGFLFAHATKSKMINNSMDNYGIHCFMYIHQNPILARLVDKIEDWKYSSFPDYIGIRNGTLPNQELALEILNLDKSDIYNLTYQLLTDKTDDDFL